MPRSCRWDGGHKSVVTCIEVCLRQPRTPPPCLCTTLLIFHKRLYLIYLIKDRIASVVDLLQRGTSFARHAHSLAHIDTAFHHPTQWQPHLWQETRLTSRGAIRCRPKQTDIRPRPPVCHLGYLSSRVFLPLHQMMRPGSPSNMHGRHYRTSDILPQYCCHKIRCETYYLPFHEKNTEPTMTCSCTR